MTPEPYQRVNPASSYVRVLPTQFVGDLLNGRDPDKLGYFLVRVGFSLQQDWLPATEA